VLVAGRSEADGFQWSHAVVLVRGNGRHQVRVVDGVRIAGDHAKCVRTGYLRQRRPAALWSVAWPIRRATVDRLPHAENGGGRDRSRARFARVAGRGRWQRDARSAMNAGAAARRDRSATGTQERPRSAGTGRRPSNGTPSGVPTSGRRLRQRPAPGLQETNFARDDLRSARVILSSTTRLEAVESSGRSQTRVSLRLY
jgi:hypothetical protein